MPSFGPTVKPQGFQKTKELHVQGVSWFLTLLNGLEFR